MILTTCQCESNSLLTILSYAMTGQIFHSLASASLCSFHISLLYPHALVPGAIEVILHHDPTAGSVCIMKLGVSTQYSTFLEASPSC